MINDFTTYAAVAEKVSPGVFCLSSARQVRAFDCGRRHREELAGMAVGTPNDRLQQVRGAV